MKSPKTSRVFVKIGNSEIHLWRGRGQIDRLSQKASRHDLAARINRFKPKELYIVSVVPRVEKMFISIAREHGWKLFIFSPKRIARYFAYANTLGADRAIQVLALMSDRRGPCVLVDLGTAITVDFISHKNRHEGGWITAGPRIILEGLAQKTDQLPLVSLKSLNRQWGQSTQECIRLGVSEMVKGLVCRGQVAAGRHAKVYLTGGWARFFRVPRTKYKENLVLISLKRIAEDKNFVSAFRKYSF